MWPFKRKDPADTITIEDAARGLCVLVSRAGSSKATCEIDGLTYRSIQLGDWTVTAERTNGGGANE